ncbi:hypothetical protein T265_15530 [Opisthorchis viverrini]|uniref:Peptidase C13 family protein n=1 Tax=Opisthorchis viverrini TaxID=6198 RepID=A0A074ZW90_OPIVI|nr:hypothetical protein T265_15530 [Opisthorchis viverrini]KER19469.1 hypothetical protein T265_15530 [Opisthorchis viverrini]
MERLLVGNFQGHYNLLNWVVLVAGSFTWENYRHQADVYRAYQIVRKNKVPVENIITFAYDDIANNPKNPFKGKVFYDYRHKDVYNGLVIDYRGIMYAMELMDTLAYMHSKKMFNKLVLYVEACNSGSMFRNVLPSNVGIYVTTSSKEGEASFSIYCDDKDIDVCLANDFSYAWLSDSDHFDIKRRTLEQQYEAVRKCTVFSHVMKYGELEMGSLPVGKFQGHYDLLMHRNDEAIAPNAVDRKPSYQAHLFSKSRRLMLAATEDEHETALRKLHRALQLGQIVKETFREIVVDVTTHNIPTPTGLSKRDELVSEVAQHSSHLMELCKAGYEVETLIDSVHNICS